MTDFDLQDDLEEDDEDEDEDEEGDEEDDEDDEDEDVETWQVVGTTVDLRSMCIASLDFGY